ncbi:hypothetical protein Hdeb2414_s0020g00556051 [Helianthus debilis subsp. tardiflorus]
MERALSGTKTGGCKLKANVAKFAAENRGLFCDDRSMKVQKKKETETNHGHQYGFSKNQVNVNQKGGKSFRDLFTGDKPAGEPSVGRYVGRSVDVPGDTMAFKDEFGKALVGRCVDLPTLNLLNKLLLDSGVGGVCLSYLGGLHILLKFPDEVSCSSFVTNNNLWNKWFAILDVWLGQSLPFERIAWINMIGVPIHLAVDSVHDSIASRFGKVIHGSNRSVADSDLSVNCVGVLVGEGARINEQVDLRWDNKSYRVWVEEEVTGWVPDCLDVDDTSEVGVPSVEELKSVRQFPVKPPVVDNHVSDFQADPVTSPVDDQSSLHGDTNRPSASYCMDVGPANICLEEREDECFVFNVADKPRKFKRRPINRSPIRERMNLDQTSPLDDGRVKKGPGLRKVIHLT